MSSYIEPTIVIGISGEELFGKDNLSAEIVYGFIEENTVEAFPIEVFNQEFEDVFQDIIIGIRLEGLEINPSIFNDRYDIVKHRIEERSSKVCTCQAVYHRRIANK